MCKNDLLYLNEEHCEAKSNAKCLNCIARTGHQNNEQGYLYQTVSQLFSLRSINAGEDRLEYIDGFRAPSGHVRDNYTKFGFEEEKIHVIPHPLNDDFLVDHTSDFSEPINILYVGSSNGTRESTSSSPSFKDSGSESTTSNSQ